MYIKEKMNNYEEFRRTCYEMNLKVIQWLKEFEATLIQNDQELVQCIQKDVEQFHKTGILIPNFVNNRQEVRSLESTCKTHGCPKKVTNVSDSTVNSTDSAKESAPEISQVPETTADSVRRNILQVNQQINQPLNTKCHPSDHEQGVIHSVVVKVEKLSVNNASQSSQSTEINNAELQVKKEAIEMPPPPRPPLGRNQRAKGKLYKNANLGSDKIKLELLTDTNKAGPSTSSTLSELVTENNCDSDVEIYPEPIDAIILNDTVDEKSTRTRGRTKNKRKLENKSKNNNESEGKSKKQKQEEDEQTTRVTRTKTRATAKNKQAEKQSQSNSSAVDEETKVAKSQPKRTKTKYQKAVENNSASEYEEETVVINKPTVLNQTVVIEKPKNTIMDVTMAISALNSNKKVIEDALITDDEDVSSSPVVNQTKKTKAVFSPYEETLVKKRVQAFEQLCAKVGSKTPSKIPCASNKTATNEKVTGVALSEKTNVSSKSKETSNSNLTPLKSNLQPRNLSNSTASNSLMSELKASQSETRTRQFRQKQKENEVLRKQQALTEERKRRREERQLRAQQARDAIVREKQKLIDDALKAKQEKLKKMLSEKEEKLQKQRAQADLKRAQVIKKAAEEQKINEKQPEIDVIPPYLKYETPLLPTFDCYDSDDEKASNPLHIRSWEKKSALYMIELQMQVVYPYKTSLFINCPKTPNLREIFPTIELHKLKRTSSAVWDRSGMSRLDTLSEED